VVAFFHPLFPNRDPDVSTNLRLGICYGRVAEVSGLDIAAIVGRTDRNSRGVHVTGVCSWVGDTFRGIGVTGGVGVVGGTAQGIQLAAGVNFDRGAFSGLQAAGLFNFVEGDVAGVQLASVYNLCNSDVAWLQFASVLNANAGSLHGVQIAAANLTHELVHGAQVGFYNGAGRVEGVQVGIANFAGPVRGSQIGIFSLARRTDGVPIGVVNISQEDGSEDWVAFASSYAVFNAGVRTAVHGWYSMFTAGIDDLEDDRSSTLFLSWHYGHAWDVRAGWRLGADLGFVHVIPKSSDEPGVNDDLHYAIQPRILVERSMGSKWNVFAGAGASAIVSGYSSDAAVDYVPLGLLGISFD